jgi:trans-2,3-dihydro-3-hydroxyanthranilate isomerase
VPQSLELPWEAGEPGRYYVVDAFTDTPLQGNQLAVFTEASGLSGERMQSLALEIGFSETVFAMPPEGDGDIRVRIFTPTRELPFAGHPVLGTACLVGQAWERQRITLETGLGTVPIELEHRGEGVSYGRMEQKVPKWRPYEHADAMLAALGVKRSTLPVEAYENGPLHVYVALESEAEVTALAPDMGALAELGEACANCFAGEGSRWKTRMFGPGSGVPEDPATGSAAGPLAIHLARHGRVAFGERIEIRQGEEIGRPSLLHASVEGSGDRIDRVEVGGSAVVVARGEFKL